MNKLTRNSMKNTDYIFELYKLLERKVPDDRIADWMALNGIRHSNQMVKQTFKVAGREDLIEYFIKEADINVGDVVRSRMTSRIGKVIGIHKDGDTIEVSWEAGGSQLLSKESVFKMRSVDAVQDTKGMTKVKTIYDNYGDVDKK